MKLSAHRLGLGPEPRALRLAEGDYLICAEGGAWLTGQALAAAGVSGDLVLGRGEFFRASGPADVLASALRRHAPAALIHATTPTLTLETGCS